MDTFLEMQTQIQSDLNVDSGSSLFPLTTIKNVINRAYIKTGALYRWPALEDSRKASTVQNQDYYDAPQTWRPNSIWRLEVDGKLYGEDPDGSPRDFADFLLWLDENPTSTDKKWAVQWLRYFIHPTPTSNGSNNITIWGQENVVALSNDGDTTIFSYSMPEGNEAIILEAEAILKGKGEDERSGQFRSAEALKILTIAFKKIREERAKIEKVEPMFDVDDFFVGGASKLKEDIEHYGNF